MDEIAPIALMVSLIYTVVAFLQYVRGRDWNGVSTIGVVWVAGVLGVLLFAQTDFADVLIPGTGFTFAGANTATLVFVGLTMGASSTVLRELVKAIDNSTSTRKPHLVPAEPPRT